MVGNWFGRGRTRTVARLTCYTRAGCCLCDRARKALDRLAADGVVTVTYVPIAGDPALEARYGQRVPVVCRGDEVLAEGKVSAIWLARRLAART